MSNTTALTEIGHEEFKELLAWRIEDTAEWRSAKVKQHPDDFRNLDAVKRLEQLKVSMQFVSIESLNILDQVCASVLADNEAGLQDAFNDTLSERLRWIGFGYKPETAQQFVDGLIKALKAQ